MGFIKKIRIQNFKSLEDVTLDIKPLNFLFGPNSSGKSSFIKAMLFLNKNLFPLNSGKLIYKIDADTDLVSYSDIVTGNDTSRNIVFEIDLAGNYRYPENPFEIKIPQSNYYTLEDINSDGEETNENRNTNPIYKFDFSVKITFNGTLNSGKGGLSKIEINDKIEDFELMYFCIENNGFWKPFKKNRNKKNPMKIEYEILDILTSEKSLNRNVFNPFSNISSIDNNKYNEIKKIINKDKRLVDNYDIKNIEIKVARLYYLNFVLLPNILRSTLSNKHLGTVRHIPKKKYLLNDDSKFESDIYYNFLNELYDHQESLINLKLKISEMGNSNNDPIKSFLDFFEAINGIKKDLNKITSDKFFQNDETINEYITKELSDLEHYLYNLFWIFEGPPFGEEIIGYDNVIKYIDNAIKSEEEIKLELIIFRKLKKDISHLIYRLYENNFEIKSTREERDEEEGRMAKFIYNFSFLINNLLIELGFHSLVFIDKKEETGGIITFNNILKKINIINESSGLLQSLPILLSLVLIKSNLNNRFCFEDGSEIIKYDYFSCVEINGHKNDYEYKRMKEMNFVLFIEQPELHLHPKLQCKLAEYIGDLSNLFIPFNHLFIETHSEHIIRKMQVLISRGELSKNKVEVNYLFKDNNGRTKNKKMLINENGFFEESWPEGFFDDSYKLTKELLFGNKN